MVSDASSPRAGAIPEGDFCSAYGQVVRCMSTEEIPVSVQGSVKTAASSLLDDFQICASMR